MSAITNYQFGRAIGQYAAINQDIDDEDELTEEELDEEAFNESMTGVEGVHGQCGMRTIVDLEEDCSLANQIRWLETAFEDEYNGGGSGASQVLITDVVSEEKKVWAETKAHSYHGPATVNPNTGNRIKVYICTKETLRELKALLKKQNKGKRK